MPNLTTINLLALATSLPYQSSIAAQSNITNTPASLVFQSFNSRFASLVGANPSSKLIAKRNYDLAHEAGIYLPATNSLYIASNYASLTNPTNVTVLNLDTYQITAEKPLKGIVMPNGGCAYPYPFNGSQSLLSPALQKNNVSVQGQSLLWADQGTFKEPSGLFLANPLSNTSSPVLTSFYGEKPFISLNDVVVHGVTGDIFFTDAPYGYYQHFRPKPSLPNQVYRFTPSTGELSVITDAETTSNGLEFSPDFKTLYVTDSGQGAVNGTTDYSAPSTIYAYDVIDQKYLRNRRTFAYIAYGIPDGIHTDRQGNVWVGVGDGVAAYDVNGTLLGKIVRGTSCNNFAFVKAGMVMFCNRELWLAGIKTRGRLVGNQK